MGQVFRSKSDRSHADEFFFLVTNTLHARVDQLDLVHILFAEVCPWISPSLYRLRLNLAADILLIKIDLTRLIMKLRLATKLIIKKANVFNFLFSSKNVNKSVIIVDTTLTTTTTTTSAAETLHLTRIQG